MQKKVLKVKKTDQTKRGLIERERERVPAVLNRHVPGLPNGDLLERFDREHEVAVPRVTVASAVGGESIIRRTKIGGGNKLDG